MTEPRYVPQQLWPTPVLAIYHDVPALNAGLAQAILEQEPKINARGRATPVAGLQDGLTTHWLEYNVLHWDYPECRELARMILAGAREFIRMVADPDDPDYRIRGISCWANVLRPGQSLAIHHH